MLMGRDPRSETSQETTTAVRVKPACRGGLQKWWTPHPSSGSLSSGHQQSMCPISEGARPLSGAACGSARWGLKRPYCRVRPAQLAGHPMKSPCKEVT